MATQLPGTPGLLQAGFAEHPDPNRSGNPIYPWHQWADGNTWHLLAGHDYHTSTASFTNAAKQYAHRHQMHLQRRQTPDGLYVRLTPKESTT